jgi:fimbrial isopeptide formation D2 family protein/LPXTG-motif cell wall-anchored protein
MKITKRLLSLLMALTLVLALSVSAFAATGHVVTITSKTSGHTYQAYQVFSGTYDKASGKLSDIEWGSGVNVTALLTALKADTTIGSKFTSATKAGDVAAAMTGATAEETDAFAVVIANNLSSTVAGTSKLTAGSTYDYTISPLNDGYYFIKEDTSASTAAYTKYILRVVGDMTVEAKTDSPSVTKKVLENNDAAYKDKWNDAADYSIGDSVSFRLVGLVPNMDNYKAYSYKFTDTLSEALTFDKSSVKVYSASGTSMLGVNSSASVGAGGTLIDDSKYKLDETTDGFTLSFTDLKTTEGISNGSYIVVEYKATLNSKAVIGNSGNPNEVTLTYSNNPNDSGSGTPSTGTTPKDEVVVFTFNLPINKTDKSGGGALSGATFALFSDKTAADAAAADTTKLGSALKFDGSDGDYTYNAVGGTTVSLTDNGGKYSIKGLDQGTYYLVELTAPAGYDKLTSAQEIKITPEYNKTAYENGHVPDATDDQLSTIGISLNGGTAATYVNIANGSGSALPSTGGIGTKVFTFGGIALMLAAAVVFVAKRRTSRGEE